MQPIDGKYYIGIFWHAMPDEKDLRLNQPIDKVKEAFYEAKNLLMKEHVYCPGEGFWCIYQYKKNNFNLIAKGDGDPIEKYLESVYATDEERKNKYLENQKKRRDRYYKLYLECEENIKAASSGDDSVFQRL